MGDTTIFEILDVAPGDIEGSVAVAQAKGDRQRWLEGSIRTSWPPKTPVRIDKEGEGALRPTASLSCSHRA